MFAAQLQGAISHAQFSDLNALAHKLWKAHAAGHLGDEEAQELAEQLEARRPKGQGVAGQGGAFRNASAGFPVARCQRSPDKIASIERRRRLAACWPLPPALASHFTISEQAALRVIADEMKRYGSCAMFIDRVAAIAGCCRTVVKNCLRKAKALRLLTVEERRRKGQRSLTNVVRWLSAAWRQWITRRKIGGIFLPTTNHEFRSYRGSDALERAKEGVSGLGFARSMPRSPPGGS